jgi:hypothetical protein
MSSGGLSAGTIGGGGGVGSKGGGGGTKKEFGVECTVRSKGREK